MRRKFCFEVNASRVAGLGRLYLWTFTRRECESLNESRAEWNKLLIYLRRKLPAWSGIRVFECHPGKWGEFSHGLHVHVLCNAFHDVNLVREAARNADWGRIHVRRIKANRWSYVAKYLFKPRIAAFKGWRLWSCFNMPERSRMKDIIIDTLRSRLFSYGFIKYGKYWRGLRWGEKLQAVRQWERETIEGRPLSYPLALLNRDGDYRQSNRKDFTKAIFAFVGMGRKQGQFHFASGASGATHSGGSAGIGASRSSGARITGGVSGAVKAGGYLRIEKTQIAG